MRGYQAYCGTCGREAEEDERGKREANRPQDAWTVSAAPLAASSRLIARALDRARRAQAIGKSDRTIAKRFGITKVRRYLKPPDVQAAIAEAELELYERKEKVDTALFWDSLRSMRHLIRGERVFDPKLKRKVWAEKPSVKAIELLWEAHGRLPRGRGKDGGGNGGDTITNTQVNVLTREDAKAAMSLLCQERERQKREREIELDPTQVE